MDITGSSKEAPADGNPEFTDHVVRDLSKKRENFISWDDYFMSVAFLSAMRSKDPCSQVGACIINTDNRIVGIGYNGMPLGCSDDDFPWGKDSPDLLQRKYMYVCHAEMNAILNKIGGELKTCRIYVGLFPCNECAKLIIQSGMKQVIYYSNKNWDKPESIATRRMFDAAGVEYDRYVPKNEKIIIDFRSIDWNKETIQSKSQDKESSGTRGSDQNLSC